MKKIKRSILLMMFVTTSGLAQVHTDPNNGYIGIGNTAPLAPLHVSGGSVMTHGWRRTSLLQANYPTQVFNSSNKFGGIGYDFSYGMCFWANAPTEDISALSPAMSLLNDGNVVIGSGGLSNPQGWNRVLQLNGNQHAKLLVTESSGVKLGMYAHIGYNAKIGTESNHNLTFTAGYWNDVMTLTTDGNVGVGTLTPNERLAVNGKIRAKEIKVEATNWPDYVFEEGYKVETLEGLESYIKKNKHLPGMPTAREAETNGIAVGEMLKLQQQKIEELTLHLIEKDKQLLNEKETNKKQQDQLITFEERLKKLEALNIHKN